MTVRMRHPKHGFTHTGDGVSVDDLKRHGWVVDTPVKAEQPPVLKEQVDIKEQYKAKFGKFPHHLKSLKTIMAELNDNGS